MAVATDPAGAAGAGAGEPVPEVALHNSPKGSERHEDCLPRESQGPCADLPRSPSAPLRRQSGMCRSPPLAADAAVLSGLALGRVHVGGLSCTHGRASGRRSVFGAEEACCAATLARDVACDPLQLRGRSDWPEGSFDVGGFAGSSWLQGGSRAEWVEDGTAASAASAGTAAACTGCTSAGRLN